MPQPASLDLPASFTKQFVNQGKKFVLDAPCPSVNIDSKGVMTSISQPNQPAKPPPPPKPPSNPTFKAGNTLSSVSDYITYNNSYIDRKIKDAMYIVQNSGHDQCNDQWTVNTLSWVNNFISDISNRFANISGNEDVKSDLQQSYSLVTAVKEYYDKTIVDFHKQNEVDPINQQIADLQSQVDDITVKNNFILKELDLLGYSISLNADMQKNVEREITRIHQVNEVLSSHDSQNKLLLYNGINTENSVFDNKLQNIKNTATTDEKNSEFLIQNSSWLNLFKKILFFGYYVLIVGVIYVFFIANGFGENFKMNIFYLILLMSYPFYIGYFEQYFLYIFTLLFSFLTGKVYKGSDPRQVNPIADVLPK
jgi:hypothetical protein